MGLSHSPMMALPGEKWKYWAKTDYGHPMLYDEQGRRINYQQLESQRNARYVNESTPEHLIQQYHDMKTSFSKLKNELEASSPDVLIVIGNEHQGEELVDHRYNPALSIYTGDTIVSGVFPTEFKGFEFEDGILEQVGVGLGMDQHHEWPGSSEFAEKLVSALIDEEFDVGVIKKSGETMHGHAWTTVMVELMQEKQIPIIPLHLNTFPPNELTPSRCYDLGKAIYKVIQKLPDTVRVGIIASGGLSHFVTDTDIDNTVIEAIKSKSEQTLRQLPRERLKAGSSEIRNWVILAGAMEEFNLNWLDYTPVFRTLGGTGIGMTFASWVKGVNKDG